MPASTHRLTADVNLLENKAIAGSAAGSFPFMDFGNKLFQAGAGFENAAPRAPGIHLDQIAAQLYNPEQPVAQAEVGRPTT